MLIRLTSQDACTVRVLARPPEEATAAGEVGVMLQVGSLLRDLSVRELSPTLVRPRPRLTRSADPEFARP
jgi:hypothetical protein